MQHNSSSVAAKNDATTAVARNPAITTNNSDEVVPVPAVQVALVPGAQIASVFVTPVDPAPMTQPITVSAVQAAPIAATQTHPVSVAPAIPGSAAQLNALPVVVLKDDQDHAIVATHAMWILADAANAAAHAMAALSPQALYNLQEIEVRRAAQEYAGEFISPNYLCKVALTRVGPAHGYHTTITLRSTRSKVIDGNEDRVGLERDQQERGRQLRRGDRGRERRRECRTPIVERRRLAALRSSSTDHRGAHTRSGSMSTDAGHSRSSSFVGTPSLSDYIADTNSSPGSSIASTTQAPAPANPGLGSPFVPADSFFARRRKYHELQTAATNAYNRLHPIYVGFEPEAPYLADRSGAGSPGPPNHPKEYPVVNWFRTPQKSKKRARPDASAPKASKKIRRDIDTN